MSNKISEMSLERTETRISGKTRYVPSANISGRELIVKGRPIRIAAVKDEELVEGEVVPEPSRFVSALRKSDLKADLLVFPQRFFDSAPKHDYPMEWDNAAVARTDSFDEWWKKLPQETRKNVRRATKRGVSVRVARFDEDFLKGIKAIYDESPFRQGRRFWHYGKGLETIKKENSTYLGRSEFIGAYYEDELIGFIKFVYVDEAAKLMQILSKNAHFDKRPMNALVAKAVEVCQEKGISYLVYSQFTFGNKKDSQLTEFKRRNGFEQMSFPRYYVPLTLRGKVALSLKLHRGLLEILPSRVIKLLLSARSALVRVRAKQWAHRSSPSAEQTAIMTEGK